MDIVIQQCRQVLIKFKINKVVVNTLMSADEQIIITSFEDDSNVLELPKIAAECNLEMLPISKTKVMACLGQ